jgi:hypothetical protein
MKHTTKQFLVASVASNMNSFGLTGMILIARDGEAWEVGANHLNVRKKGEFVDVPYGVSPNWAALSYELPRVLPCPPVGVMRELFP